MMLTPRQYEVARLVAQGMGSKSIARELNISTETVREHIKYAASRIDLPGRPRHRLTVFILRIHEEDDAA